MQIAKEMKKVEAVKVKNQNKKSSNKFDKPIPKPKTAPEDGISKYRGLSRENYGVRIIL